MSSWNNISFLSVTEHTRTIHLTIFFSSIYCTRDASLYFSFSLSLILSSSVMVQWHWYLHIISLFLSIALSYLSLFASRVNLRTSPRVYKQPEFSNKYTTFLSIKIDKYTFLHFYQLILRLYDVRHYKYHISSCFQQRSSSIDAKWLYLFPLVE
jgi:hypothetical protein